MLFLKKALLGMIIVAIVVSMNISHPVQAQTIHVPSNIRVGLHFVGSFSDTTITSFRVSASGGVRVGVNLYGEFAELHRYTGNDEIQVIMDAPGTRYFVRIGGEYTNRSDAVAALIAHRDRGIPAYLAYDHTWQVWAGHFTDASAASSAATNTYAPRAAGQATTVVTSPVRNLRIINASGEVLAVLLRTDGSFQVRPAVQGAIVHLNGRGYRGYLEARRYLDSDMTVINILPLQHYLYGVVPNEMHGSAHQEALKAQAVAARTYVLAQLGRYMRYGFDVCNTTATQVYRGYSNEQASTNQAVDATDGEVVTFLGSLAITYYFACSGGMTENSENVWFAPTPYLVGVEDSYEVNHRLLDWSFEYTAEEIQKALENRGHHIGQVRNIQVTDVTESGRVFEMVVYGTNGQAVLQKEQNRTTLSPSLPSQKFYVQTDAHLVVQNGVHQFISVDPSQIRIQTDLHGSTVYNAKQNGLSVLDGIGYTVQYVHFHDQPGTYVFVGKGNGHGVGMSQAGAIGMANAGYSYRQILTHYYQGTEVRRISSS